MATHYFVDKRKFPKLKRRNLEVSTYCVKTVSDDYTGKRTVELRLKTAYSFLPTEATETLRLNEAEARELAKYLTDFAEGKESKYYQLYSS